MAIYIEESFFRPILAVWPQGQNQALFIPAANAAGDGPVEPVRPYNQQQTRRFAPKEQAAARNRKADFSVA